MLVPRFEVWNKSAAFASETLLAVLRSKVEAARALDSDDVEI